MNAPARRHELFNRRTAAIGVFALWIMALAWLVDRHYLGERVPQAGESARWPVPPGAAFYAIRHAERQIGLATLTVDTLAEGLRVTELSTIDLPRLVADTPRRTSQRTDALYTRGMQLVRFQTDILSEDGRLQMAGTIEGDSVLVLVTGVPLDSFAIDIDTTRISLRRPVILPAAIPLVAASRGLPKPGSRLNLEVFDPIEREVRVERITVVAESLFIIPDSAEFSDVTRRWEQATTDTLRAWRLDWLVHGLPTRIWVDGAGLPVQIAHRFGAMYERSAFEIVQANFRSRPPPVYDTSVSAPLYTQPSAAIPTRKSLSVLARLGTTTRFPRNVPSLSEGWQLQSGDTFVVTRRPSTAPAESLVTATPLFWSLATPDSALAAEARTIVGTTADPARMGELLAAAIRKRVKSRPGETRYPASQVLVRGAGTAQEQVNLLVGMAVALGLHARTAWGLVLVEGRWVLRPWAEIWTDNWTPFDIAMNGHDAGRFRLGTGGASRYFGLATQAGQVRLQVLEEQR